MGCHHHYTEAKSMRVTEFHLGSKRKEKRGH